MSDELTVSVGGTSVVVEELLATARALEQVVLGLGAIRSRVAGADALGARAWAPGGVPSDALRAEADLDEARAILADTESLARSMAWALTAAAHGYARADDAVRAILGYLADEVGAAFGLLLPGAIMAAIALPGIVVIPAALGAAAASVLPRSAVIRATSNPLAIAAVRFLVRGADDALMAGMGIPGPVRQFVGDRGAGRAGVPFVGAAIAGLARPLGALREGPVRVAEATPLPAAAPVSGFGDRVARIPDPDELDGAQLVIEQYVMPDGSDRYEVFIAGTIDFGVAETGEPWDMASNVTNAVGPGSGSYEATAAALRQAGIGPDDPVQFTGHSQGGAVAAWLAASGEFATAGVVSFGGPTGSIPLPDDIPAVLVEHTDDLVVAMGGEQRNDAALVVERYASEDTDFETAPFAPAHRIPAYAETARLMDRERDPRLADAAARIDSFTEGAVLVERTAYRCERVESAPTSS